MKLVIAGFIALLVLPAVAAAEDIGPPGGSIYTEAPPYRGDGAPLRGRGRGRLRAVVIAKFDANGDGRLQPQERQRAKRALREKRIERLFRRFDTTGDGNVGPEEMPRGQARKLRGLDRDRDGWLEPNERR